MRHDGLETKHIAIDPGRPVLKGNRWRVDKVGGRYLFIGPQPGRFLFWSTDGRDWQDAINKARDKWQAMDPARRERWYGPSGVYAKLAG